MTLNNIKKSNKGFTIVELLIVVVVIAILAAISIVSYQGIQARSRNSAAAAAASQVVTKLEAYKAVQGAYPLTQAAMNSVNESQLENVSLGTPTAANGTSTVLVQLCSGDVVQVTAWDYNNNATGTPNVLGGATCASAAAFPAS